MGDEKAFSFQSIQSAEYWYNYAHKKEKRIEGLKDENAALKKRVAELEETIIELVEPLDVLLNERAHPTKLLVAQSLFDRIKEIKTELGLIDVINVG